MANVVSVTGCGARGGIGLEGNSTDTLGTVFMLFDAQPWEKQPEMSGQAVVTFAGKILPNRFVPVDGWGTVDAHVGATTTILWKSGGKPGVPSRVAIAYSFVQEQPKPANGLT